MKTYLISTTGSTTGYVSSNDAVTRALESAGGFRRCSRDEYEQHRRRLTTLPPDRRGVAGQDETPTISTSSPERPPAGEAAGR